ncbi:MAG: PIG-L deacetylase family protein [Patescibacteria group bacterium]
MNPVVGIFAHPDDEVFGPGGTLATFAAEGRDVYLICVTDGDAGENNTDDTRQLHEIRRDELKASAKVLGIKQIYFLGYKDGTLSNNLYHEIANKIATFLRNIRPEIIFTLEPKGITGHLDHIAVSFITSFVFERDKNSKELWYACLTEQTQAVFKKHFPDYFIYMPPGYPQSAISKTVDIGAVWEQKQQAMAKHRSQKNDIDRLLEVFISLPREEHFFIIKK